MRKNKKILCYLLMTVLAVSGVVQSTGRTTYADDQIALEADTTEEEPEDLGTDEESFPKDETDIKEEQVENTEDGEEDLATDILKDETVKEEQVENTEDEVLDEDSTTYIHDLGQGMTLSRSEVEELIEINQTKRIIIYSEEMINHAKNVAAYGIGEMKQVEGVELYDFSYTITQDINSIPFMMNNELQEDYFFTVECTGTIPGGSDYVVYGFNDSDFREELIEKEKVKAAEGKGWWNMYEITSDALVPVPLHGMTGWDFSSYRSTEPSSYAVFWGPMTELSVIYPEDEEESQYEYTLSGKTTMSKAEVEELIAINETRVVRITVYPEKEGDLTNYLMYTFEIGDMVLVSGVTSYDFSITLLENVADIPVALPDDVKENFALYAAFNGILPIKSDVRVDIATSAHLKDERWVNAYGVDGDKLVATTVIGSDGFRVSIYAGSYKEYILLFGEQEAEISLLDTAVTGTGDENTTSESNQNQLVENVQTGDTTSMLFYAVLMILAMLITSGGIYYRRLRSMH